MYGFLRGILFVVAILFATGILLYFIFKRGRREGKSLAKDLNITQTTCDKAEKRLAISQKEIILLQKLFLATVAIEILSNLEDFFRDNPNLWADLPRKIGDKIEVIGENISFKSSNQLFGEIDAVIDMIQGTFAVIKSGENDFWERTLFAVANNSLEQIKKALFSGPLADSTQEIISAKKEWRICVVNYVKNTKQKDKK